MNKLIIILGVCILIGIGVYMAYFQQDRNEERDIVLSWSGLSVVPSWAQNVHIETKGGGFSREFIMSFLGNKDEIKTWIEADSVFKTATVKHVENSEVYTYVLEPQGGAQYAEIVINMDTGEVKVRVYWS